VIVTGPADNNNPGTHHAKEDTTGRTARCGPTTPIILDSNVWIDLHVFADPDVEPIRQALRAGTLHAVIDDACLRELARVLLYPQFVPYAVDDAKALAQTRAWTHHVTPIVPEEAGPTTGAALPLQPVLPRCSDRDDQKFLALAASTGARWLVTKDKALLKLHRRMLRDFGCHVVLPTVFTAQALGVT